MKGCSTKLPEGIPTGTVLAGRLLYYTRSTKSESPIQDPYDDRLPYDFPIAVSLYWLIDGEQLKRNACNIHAQEK